MAKNPNPQGKGVVPLLAIWEATTPATVIAKSANRIIGEYFTSLLVLSAEFSFKPVVGKDYYLYWRQKKSNTKQTSSALRLSLIEPERLGALQFGRYVGSCCLQTDMTWAINPSEALAQEHDIIEDIRTFHQQFLDNHNHEKTLEDSLPVFVESLPFYRRLAATALSSSLQRSIKLSELSAIPAKRWIQESQPGLPLLKRSQCINQP